MSLRGNGHDNACAACFFVLLKRDLIRRKVYRSEDEGKAYVFNYIELLSNPTRSHGNNNDLSSMEFNRAIL